MKGYNPILPLTEYIPDGEPHVFEGRLYLFGSHDIAGGTRYCQAGNYVTWSAPVEDLTDWRYDGVIYDASQDPAYTKGSHCDLYAPDVVRGNDGRYYMYYNIVNNDNADSGFTSGCHVAVSDRPQGPYEFYGIVRNPDGSVYNTYLVGDPAVINDGGIIRLYAGWSLSFGAAAAHAQGRNEAGQAAQEEKMRQAAGQQQMDLSKIPLPVPKQFLYPVYKMMFGRSKEEVDALEYSLMGANCWTLADDMLTITSPVSRIVPGEFDCPRNSSFFGHAFYEASSIRKIGGLYYFIYSSQNSQELCYATSRYPDHDFVYGGTIISNGDIGYHGRKPEDRLNMTANNHGSLVEAGGQWYIFYHRQTNRSTYSRQACAEPVTIAEDGSIAQVECTTQGLAGKPIPAEGTFAAPICCNLTNGHMPHCTNTILDMDIPYVTDQNGEQYITGIKEGTRIGYKYFAFDGPKALKLQTRGTGAGHFDISTEEGKTGEIQISPSDGWKESETVISVSGTHALYFDYKGEGSSDLLAFSLE